MKTPDTTDRLLEQRLRAWYRAEVGEDQSAPLTLRRDVVMIPRGSVRRAGLFGRGRGVLLFAAAALLLVGGAAAAGSGLLRLPSLVPQVALPTFTPLPSPSVIPTAAIPTAGFSPAPTATPAVVAPKPGMFAYILTAGDHTSALWVANMDGSGARRLAQDLGGTLGAPAWSPDGTRLVFSHSDVDPTGMPFHYQLYLIDASGSEPQLVDTGCVAPCFRDSDAAFSSDGERLVFVRSGAGVGGGTGSVLATVDLTTGEVVELESTRISDASGNFQPFAPADYHPRWSPDGTRIVFTQDVPNDVSGRVGQSMPLPAVFVVDADGRNLHQIGPAAQTADWSPDGTRIVFGSVDLIDVHRRDGHPAWLQYYDIYTVRPDGTDLRRLTSDQISKNPSWTADGRIGFIRTPLEQTGGLINESGPLQFWIMDADGGNATQLSFSPQTIDQAWPISWPPQP